MKRIGGSGGGGGGGKGRSSGGGPQTYTPTEAADTLNSRQYANLIDLISEGEIQGLKDGHKSIFINNTPLQNQDNSYNFNNVTVWTRNGTQSQDYIPTVDAVENEVAVGVTVLQATPVVRSITDTAVDAVRVTINIPALQRITDQGDIVGSVFRFQISTQYSSGGYTVVVDDVIRGRTADLYQRDYLITLTGSKPVNIKVTRVTDDNSEQDAPGGESARITNAFSWSSYTELAYAKLRYPNSALVAVRIDAEQFNSIPSRSYLIRGIKVRIPSNATVDQNNGRLIYAGIWNGSFGAAQWCSDPAWILWDLLTSRYGFGQHISAAQLDKFAFYSASQYCAELVPDGFGGQEPRFSCNINIQTQEDAYKLINDMCSVFRAMPYWSTGALTISQDRPADSAYLFTLANVSEEGFSYSGSSLKTRPNVAVVSYLDLELRDVAYEVVEDQTSISKYGAITTEISAFACTSRGQAGRIGEWLLYSEQYEGEVISFSASIDAGVMVRPGQIIEVSDPVRAGARRGGRIASATTTAITVDDATGLTSSGATLSVILPDGTVAARSVASIAGKVINLTSALPTAPNANSIWILETASIQTSTWRVISVAEQDQATYQISALAYNSSKYAYVERGRPLEVRDITDLNEIPDAPVSFSFEEALYSYQNQIRAKVIVSWPAVLGIAQYRVKWRKDSANWAVVDVLTNDYEILDITPGLFEVQVFSMSAALKLSTTAAIGSITALGKTAPPSNVTGFSSVLDGNIGATLIWNPVPDLDLSEYEIRQGTVWASATFVTKVAATSYKLGQLAPGTRSYMIRAIDTSGVYSAAAASTTVTITSPSTPSVTATVAGDLVTLSWPASTASYAIAAYVVRSSAGAIGEIKTTTTSLPITWSGLRTFFVKAVDLAGNESAEGSVAVTVTQAPAPSVSVGYAGDNAVLTWNEVNGTTKTRFYRVLRGATALATIQTTSFSVKVDWVGSQAFSVQAADANGNLGAAATVTVSPVAAVAPTVGSTFSGAQVVLSWNSVEGTLPTSYYDVRYGDSFAGGQPLGVINSNSFTVNGAWTGDRTFFVAAVDTAGNVGAAGSRTVSITAVTAPTISASFAGDLLTLVWSGASSLLPIASYELRRGTTYATATILGRVQSTTFKTEATWLGAQTFWVTGINSNGDLGTPGSVVATVQAPPGTNVLNTFAGEEVLLAWNAVQGSLDTAYYQVRRGSTFASATVLTEIKSTAYSLKVNWGGTQRFWVVAFDVRGNQGPEQFQDVVVASPSAPSISQQVIDNNVLLRWTDSTQTLPIVYYELRRGSTYAGGTSVGTKQGLFTTVFETVSGEYTYWLAGIDTAGNVGTPASVRALVNQPPDYILRSDINSTFSGTSTNLTPNGTGLLATVDTTETWQSHFTSRGWSTLQDQVSAGFTIYAMPSTTTGSYVEELDYGTVLAGTKITSTLTRQTVAGSVTVAPTLSVKTTAGGAWTDYAGQESVYATNFQYVKVRYDFTSAGNDDLLQLSALNIRLDIKIKNDMGNGTANAGDTGGTTVNFNVPFADIESIGVTPSGTTPRIAIYDFVDAPNPTSFKVLLFDTAGNRVSGPFSWQARGS
jgi:predicted phage tail protein